MFRTRCLSAFFGFGMFILHVLASTEPSSPPSAPSPSSAANSPQSKECASVRKSASQFDMMQQVVGQYYSIGYTSLDVVASQKQPLPGACGVQYGDMVNQAGNVVKATVASIQSSVLVGTSTCPGFGLCASIQDTQSPTGWPMSFLSYIVVPTKLTDTSCNSSSTFSPSCVACLKLKTVYDYISWTLTAPEAASVLHGASFATLPSYVITRIRSEIFPNIRCAGSDNIFSSVKDWPADTQAVTLVGGGASVQSNVQVALANAFNIETSVSISFAPFDPSKKQLSNKLIQFEFKDFALDTTDDIARLQGHVMIPIMAAAIVPIYNLEVYETLVFSRVVLNAFFSGAVTSWHDPAMKQWNPSAILLPEAPVRIVRSEHIPQDGVPIHFLAALQSFSNSTWSASSGLAPDQYTWPDQHTPYSAGETCSNKKCVLQVCNPGYFFDVPSNGCLECPVGTFAINVGSLSCQPCPPGTYTDVTGTKGCSKCDDTSFQPAAGSDHCLSCPKNTRRYGVLTPSQAANPNISSTFMFGTQLEECMCVFGTWLPQSVNNSEIGGKECLACPQGARCQGFMDGVQHIPQTAVNFWGDPSNPSEFYECEVGHCMSGYNCSVGFTGRMCNNAARGYYYVAGVIRKCGSGTQGIQVFLTILEIVLWIALVNFACSQYHSLLIDMIMLQTSGYIAKINLRWDPNIDMIRIVAEFFNFEIGYVGHQCSNYDTWTKPNLFYWQLSFPFVCVALSAAWWLVKAAVRKLRSNKFFQRHLGLSEPVDVVRIIKNKSSLASVSHRAANFHDYIRIKFLMFFLSCYPVLVYTVFTPFTCSEDAFGHLYLVNMPDVPCWANTHWSMIFVACVYIPIVIVALPIILCRRLYWGLQADLLDRCSFMEYYGWIYSKYKPQYAWWEMVVLIRRALICICAAFVTVPMVSACLIIFILNLFLCAQLIVSPHILRSIRLLEVGSLFSCMIQAVAGILLYPSLDTSNECVGSTYLEDIGSICDRNNTYKHVVTILVLLTFCGNLLTSLLLFAWKVYRNQVASAAVKEVHRVFDIPYDEYDIHLSNIIDGSYLVSLLKDESLTSSPECRKRFTRLNNSIPYFIMFNHNQSGHYSQNEYAKTLNTLLATFPGLLDWIANSDRELVAGFAAFVKDYAAYAREHHNITFGQIILTAHKADVLMWLMTCNDKHREAFCKLLLGVASASGLSYFLRPGALRDNLLQEMELHSHIGVKKFPPEPSLLTSADNGALVDVITTGSADLAAEARLCASVCAH